MPESRKVIFFVIPAPGSNARDQKAANIPQRIYEIRIHMRLKIRLDRDLKRENTYPFHALFTDTTDTKSNN